MPGRSTDVADSVCFAMVRSRLPRIKVTGTGIRAQGLGGKMFPCCAIYQLQRTGKHQSAAGWLDGWMWGETFSSHPYNNTAGRQTGPQSAALAAGRPTTDNSAQRRG